ncbi:hypothetical protein [Prochlorothrix hollandica]|uniref:hypothetical protein n=1 Tax=Prochlorothrix hollandica TaxID=1223 RepID=UPI0033419C30
MAPVPSPKTPTTPISQDSRSRPVEVMGSSNGNGQGESLTVVPPATVSASAATSLDAVNQSKDVKGQFNEFIQSLGDVLADFTALEVSTMVVSNISGDKFNPLGAYRLLYGLGITTATTSPGQQTATLMNMPPELQVAYHKLYKQLLENYHLCFPDDRRGKKELPHPDREFEQVQKLLKDSLFLRSLRKLSEQKLALDGGDIKNAESKDLIYAQTVMQLDGDVINRYHQDLLEDKELREFVLSIHNQAVEAGERQWRGLINFMVELLKSFIK